MSNIFKNLREIPWPDGVYHNITNDKILYCIPDSTKPKREWKQDVIGYATKDGLMLPNRSFEEYFPDLWKEYYGDDVPSHQRVIHAGM